MNTDKIITEMGKNARELIRFRLGEFKGHRFVDMRLFTKEDGKEPLPTKKGLAVNPKLWPQFRQALDQVEEALIQEGWLDREDLDGF